MYFFHMNCSSLLSFDVSGGYFFLPNEAIFLFPFSLFPLVSVLNYQLKFSFNN